MTSGPTPTGAAGSAGGRRALLIVYGTAAAAFVGFASWGSLFPFTFHGMDLRAALAQFWGTWESGPATWSLTDLASNVLLFVPIGLFGSASLEGGVNTRRPSIPWIVAVFAFGVLLSAALEFGQAFIPWRTPSVVDVLAEAIGTAGGIGIWRVAGRECDACVRAACEAIRQAPAADRLLMVYSAAFAIAWLLPFDFTMRPNEVADKYFHKRLLLPFVPSPDAATRTDLLAAFVAAVPLGMTAVVAACPAGARRSVPRALFTALPVLIGLEIVQVFVFSRNTDATILFPLSAGVVAGAAAAAEVRRGRLLSLGAHTLRAALPVILWLSAVVICEWWPFSVTGDATIAARAAETWSRAPFRPPARIFDVLPGVVLAFGAGVFLRGRFRQDFVRLETMLVTAAAAAVFLLIEAGRLLLDGTPTLASVGLKVAAMMVGLHAATLRPGYVLPRRAG